MGVGLANFADGNERQHGKDRKPTPPPSIITPDALRLKIEPAADCGRYDSIRKIA
jgi:hypothetical protein